MESAKISPWLAHERIGNLAERAYNIGGGPANTLNLVELLEKMRLDLGLKPQVSFQPWRMADQKFCGPMNNCATKNSQLPRFPCRPRR